MGGKWGCGQEKFITLPAPAPPCSILPFLCPMADQVHLFNGVRYVPIKAIRDPDRKWLSAGWLSKQMSLNNYNKTKPADIGIVVNPGQGSRVGDWWGQSFLLM